MKSARTIFVTILLATCGGSSANASGDVATEMETRRTTLTNLITEQWEYTLRTSPEMASMLGDKRYNDRLSDLSQQAIDADLSVTRAFLRRFEAIDISGLSPQEQLNQQLMVRSLRESLDGARFKDWEMPVQHNSGIHTEAAQLVSALSFVTIKDYDDYLMRLHGLPRAFDDTILQMRNGMRDHLMPPQFLIPKIARQCDDIAAMKTVASPFAEPLSKFPEGFSAVDKTRLRREILAAIEYDVVPAYKKLSAFIKAEYEPLGRKDVGLWALPEGAARYRYAARVSTTTELSPQQIHQLGLREVERIEAQMLGTAKKLGFADLKSFNVSLITNPALHPKSGRELLELYQKYTDQMYLKLPELFTVLPKAKVLIMPVETFREKESAAAEYNPGALDGSRPGRVMINTGDYANRNTISVETTALHEGVPGHHLQLSIAQEVKDLPPFRQTAHYTAYVEGWALYSERMGEEVGFYSDPYSYYGHLQDEMLRAIRLVVDTGLHDKHWTRQQVVDFFHTHSGIDEVDVQSETDRYIASPGQALGYKVGQLKISQLRDYAQTQLGERFDLRLFHDQVVGAGALPLDVLEARIKSWVGAALLH